MSTPFERFDLDPLEGPRGITERLRERLEDATPAERDALRAAWEELTVDPHRRLSAALRSFPETRPPLPPLPPTPRVAEPPQAPLSLVSLCAPPPVLDALGAERVRAPAVLPPLASDPLLKR